MTRGIGEGEFEIGLAGLRAARGSGLELRMDGGEQGLFPGLLPESGDGDGIHMANMAIRQAAVTLGGAIAVITLKSA
jgi:hypothetical protein